MFPFGDIPVCGSEAACRQGARYPLMWLARTWETRTTVGPYWLSPPSSLFFQEVFEEAALRFSGHSFDRAGANTVATSLQHLGPTAEYSRSGESSNPRQRRWAWCAGHTPFGRCRVVPHPRLAAGEGSWPTGFWSRRQAGAAERSFGGRAGTGRTRGRERLVAA